MSAGLFGAISAGALGSADFMGRFSSRAIGHYNALLGMLVVGAALMTLRAVTSGEAAPPDRGGHGWLLTSGAATTLMTLLLYLGLARGPVSVVAPIVSAHPVLVVLFYAIISDALPSAIALTPADTWRSSPAARPVAARSSRSWPRPSAPSPSCWRGSS